MITDICIVFGCGKTLTSTEKLCGIRCTEHSGEEVVVSMVSQLTAIKMQLLVLAEHFENEARALRSFRPVKSDIVNKQRKDMADRYYKSQTMILEIIKNDKT